MGRKESFQGEFGGRAEEEEDSAAAGGGVWKGEQIPGVRESVRMWEEGEKTVFRSGGGGKKNNLGERRASASAAFEKGERA